jgi:hypothetical protein
MAVTGISTYEKKKEKENKMGWGFVYVGNKGIGSRHGSRM